MRVQKKKLCLPSEKKKKRYRTRGLTLEEWAEFEVEDIRGPVSDQMKGIMRSVY